MLFKKIISFLDKLRDFVTLVICLMIMLIGFYAIYDSYLVYQHANDDSLLQYKPGYGKEEDAKKAFHGNMVAWLTLKDTSIDYPVMQGKTNTDFLNTDPYGNYSLSGSIFLDYRNSSNFSDDYSLIYGHHMEGNAMFGGLDKFRDEGYFKKHKNGTLTVEKKKLNILLFTVIDANATENIIFAPTGTKNGEILDFAKKHAVIWGGDDISPNDKLVAFSTCRYPDTTERTVVLGVINQ